MGISVHYFASLREALNCESETIADNSISNVEDLTKLLVARGEAWQAVFEGSKVLVAVNQTMSTVESPIKDGDEVAFFPPVTGG